MDIALKEYISSLGKEVDRITKGRKKKLRKLANAIQQKVENNEPAPLLFICTHNSRRSHLCQIWAATLAEHCGLENIQTFSGGTEVTAFNSRAVEAIRRAGFKVRNPGGENPRYKVYFDEQREPLVCFSKRFGDSANPSQDFIAVMTCTDADRNCPVVPGADFRITLSYEDPKQADGTAEEAKIYDERCRQIAAEMYYMLSQLL